jgi:preprotein translocase subunit Sec61beta
MLFHKVFKHFTITEGTMARNNKVSMPSSTAGITRYFDDYRSRIEFKPGHIIILVIIVIIIELILHSAGKGWIGA